MPGDELNYEPSAVTLPAAGEMVGSLGGAPSITAKFLRVHNFFFFFWPHHEACGVLVPQPGIEPQATAVKAPSSKH